MDICNRFVVLCFHLIFFYFYFMVYSFVSISICFITNHSKISELNNKHLLFLSQFYGSAGRTSGLGQPSWSRMV